MRRIKHQPSPLGLRVHPSILLLLLNRASRRVPSHRSGPYPARRMAGASPLRGHGPSSRRYGTARLCAIAPAASHSTSRGDKAPLTHWTLGPPSGSRDAPLSARQSQPLVPYSPQAHGMGGQVPRAPPRAPAPSRAGGIQLPPLQKKLSGLNSPLPLQNGRERGPFGTSQATTQPRKALWVGLQVVFRHRKMQNFHPSLELELQKGNLVSKVIEK